MRVMRKAQSLLPPAPRTWPAHEGATALPAVTMDRHQACRFAAAPFFNDNSARIRAMSALTPISDIGRHACYRCELGASARHKAADLGVTVTVVIGPHNSRTKAVGL